VLGLKGTLPLVEHGPFSSRWKLWEGIPGELNGNADIIGGIGLRNT
jgi:hypothetical protein